MGFQSTIRYDLALGVIGEIVRTGPHRAKTAFILSADATQNVIGRAFTRNVDQTVGAGGTGIFVGLLCNPKRYASAGVTGDPLGATLLVPNDTEAEFLEMGFILNQVTNANAAEGDDVHYVEATGALLSVAPGTNPATGNAKVPNASIYGVGQTTAGNPVIIRLTN